MNLEEIRKFKPQILELAEKCNIENVRVFGSVVRGEAGVNSDVDLLVHGRENCSLYDIVHFENKMSDMLSGRKVDVLDDESIKEILAPFILAEARPL